VWDIMDVCWCMSRVVDILCVSFELFSFSTNACERRILSSWFWFHCFVSSWCGVWLSVYWYFYIYCVVFSFCHGNVLCASLVHCVNLFTMWWIEADDDFDFMVLWGANDGV
jgi:hypothetical protein